MGIALDELTDRTHLFQVVPGALPVGNLVGVVFEHLGADAARSAEAAGFVGEEVRELPRNIDHVAQII